MHGRMKNAALFLGGSILCLGVSAPAFAQEGVALEEVVVTARKTAESSQDVPIAVTTVSARALSDLSVRDISEISKLSPALYISSQGSSGRAKITIRGQAEADSRLTTDASVGVYVDGVNWSRSYGLRTSLVDVAQIEVLKGPQGTLFGRNTTGGALNITTNQPTYEANGVLDLTYGSYNNLQVLAVANMPIVADRLAVRLVAQRILRDGYGRDFNGKEIQDDNVIAGRFHVRYDYSDSVNVLLSGDYNEQRNIGPNIIVTHDAMLARTNTATGGLGAIAAQLGLNPALPADRLTAYNTWKRYYDRYAAGDWFDTYGTSPTSDPVKHYGLSGALTVDAGGVVFKSITAWRKLWREQRQDLDGSPFDLLVTYLTTDATNFSQELQVAAIDGEGLDWQLGAFYNRETGNEFSASQSNLYVNSARASVTDGDVKNTSKAVYTQVVYNLSDQFRVTGGLRYTKDTRGLVSHNRIDPRFANVPIPPSTVARCNLLNPAAGGPVFPNCNYAADVSFDKVTYLISGDYRPTDDLMFYASYSLGYRAGGFTAQGSSTLQPSVAALQAAFTPFEPEEVKNIEAGFKSEWLDRRLRINGAAYHQDYQNIQAQIRDVVNGNVITLIRNAAEAKLYGGELEVIARPTSQLDVNFGAAYVHAAYDSYFARDAAGALLDLSAQTFAVPKWTWNAGGSYTVPLDSGSLRFSANYAWTDDVIFRADTPTLSSVTQKAYGLLDARITWMMPEKALEVSLFAKNITNEHYKTAATNLEATGWNIAFPGDPATVGVQVRKTFGQ